MNRKTSRIHMNSGFDSYAKYFVNFSKIFIEFIEYICIIYSIDVIQYRRGELVTDFYRYRLLKNTLGG